ncbi:MAG: glycosyltransferase [Candidatus Bathyarchaeia archaeon]
MKVKVTIGVCVRDGAQSLPQAIESIIRQDYPHKFLEVIFVDDGSQDETLDILKKYATKMDMQVRIFHHEWKGLGPSRNVVVDNATGDYIVWVDADMILPEDHVSRQVEFMEKNPKAGIAKARYRLSCNGNLVALLEDITCIIDDFKIKHHNLKLPGTGGSIYRTNVIRQVGGFDNNLTGVGEDQDAAYRIKESGWLIKTSDAYFYEAREHSWSALWRKYFWYGFGHYFLYLKNKLIFKPYKMIPLAGFFAGLLYSFSAYRLIKRQAVFLLPLHFVLKSTAWTLGFISGFLKSV